jgi:hypothetical protein
MPPASRRDREFGSAMPQGAASRRRGPPRKRTPASSSGTTTDRRSPTCISRRSPAGEWRDARRGAADCSQHRKAAGAVRQDSRLTPPRAGRTTTSAPTRRYQATRRDLPQRSMGLPARHDRLRQCKKLNVVPPSRCNHSPGALTCAKLGMLGVVGLPPLCTQRPQIDWAPHFGAGLFSWASAKGSVNPRRGSMNRRRVGSPAHNWETSACPLQPSTAGVSSLSSQVCRAPNQNC